MELSILIATVSARKSLLSRVLSNLQGQLYLYPGQVEVIIHRGEWEPMGQKFNELYRAASGRLAVQVDDDDQVSADFVTSILDHSPGHDFVGYKIRVTFWGELAAETYPVDPVLYRVRGSMLAPRPDHVRLISPKCPILTEQAQRFRFPSYFGADHVFIADLIRDGYPFRPTYVDKVLYWYDCWPEQSLGGSPETWTPQRQIKPYSYDPNAFIWIE